MCARELHWHPTQDEWGYFIEGQGRMTIFASSSNAQTFNYEAGDVSYVPATYGECPTPAIIVDTDDSGIRLR